MPATVPTAEALDAMAFLSWAAYRQDKDKQVSDFDLRGNLTGSDWTIVSMAQLGLKTQDPDGEFYEAKGPNEHLGKLRFQTEVGAFVAVKNGTLAVVFRGSDNISDLQAAVNDQKAYFDAYIKTFLPAVLKYASALSASGAINSVYITGHSLGGAMAEWAAFQWAPKLGALGLSVSTATYGSPGTPNGGSPNAYVSDIINVGHSQDTIFTHAIYPMQGLTRHGFEMVVDLPNVSAGIDNEHNAYLYQRSMSIFNATDFGSIYLLDLHSGTPNLLTINALLNGSANNPIVDHSGWTFLGTGDDRFIGGSVPWGDHVISSGGSDRISFSGNAYYLNSTGAPANVTINGSDIADNVSFLASLNVFVETPTSAVINTFGGGDSVTVMSGNGFISLGDGDDFITFTGHPQFRVSLGAGDDTVRVNSYYTGVSFTDFETGDEGDHLYLAEIFNFPGPTSLQNYTPGSNPFTTGYMQLIQRGSSAVLQIDVDGGADQFRDLFIFENTLTTSLTAFNLGGFAPTTPSSGGFSTGEFLVDHAVVGAGPGLSTADWLVL